MGGTPKSSKCRQWFCIETHGDLGIPHELRNLHIAILIGIISHFYSVFWNMLQPLIAVLYQFCILNTPILLQVLDFVDQQHGGSPRRVTLHVGVPQSAHRSWENPPGFHRKWRTYNCWIFIDFPYMEVSQNGGTPKPGGSILRLS